MGLLYFPSSPRQEDHGPLRLFGYLVTCCHLPSASDGHPHFACMLTRVHACSHNLHCANIMP
eukprot:10302661-Alexandrium_andersonii.AAC.1